MIFSEQNENVSKALAKAWSELSNPKHNMSVTVQKKQGGSYTFDYTDLGGIFDEAKQAFKDNDLNIIQNAFSEVLNGQTYISIQTMFLHSTGEWVKSEVLRMQANNSIQDMGGQITYLKRYQLSAMLGIATEKDDDANGASGNEYETKKPNQSKSKKASTQQLNFVDNLLEQNVSEKYDKQTLFDLLIQKADLPQDMNSWTPSQASNAISTLQSKEKGAS